MLVLMCHHPCLCALHCNLLSIAAHKLDGGVRDKGATTGMRKRTTGWYTVHGTVGCVSLRT